MMEYSKQFICSLYLEIIGKIVHSILFQIRPFILVPNYEFKLLIYAHILEESDQNLDVVQVGCNTMEAIDVNQLLPADIRSDC